MKKPKRGSFVEWCISIIILRIFTVRKLSSSMQRCKEKGLSVGYCKGLYLVKNQFVTATLDYLINEHARLVLSTSTKRACSFIR